MRIAYDAAPLLNPRTGVGHYAAALLEALLAADPELEVSLFAVGRQPAPATTTGVSGPLGGAWGDGRATLRRLRIPARLVVAAWELARYPRGEVLFGRAGAVHGTNFWVPPLGRPNGVVTVHDLTFLLYPELCTPQVRRYRWIVPHVLKRCAVVLTPSETVAEQVSSELSFPRDRIVVTPEGVRHSALSPPSARREGRSYLLFTGAREPRKNLDRLLQAFAQVLDLGLDLDLVVAGPAGWGSGDLRARTVELGVAERVELPGYLSDPALATLLAGARAVAAGHARVAGYDWAETARLTLGAYERASD